MSLTDDLVAATLSFADGTARLRFSGDEVFFRGHFPEGPVLPAVVQVAAAVHFAGRMLEREVRLFEVTRAKFTHPAGPGRELVLTVSCEPAENGRTRVKAVIRDAEQEVAELSLRVM
jgi:3-hydroxymyristoyl/3-hydroxydecanoyl-(acyl carrier protein) dehydratase